MNIPKNRVLIVELGSKSVGLGFFEMSNRNLDLEIENIHSRFWLL